MSITKKLFSASATIAMAGIVARSLSIISAPILTKLLGPESYGIIALLGTFTSLGTMLAILGSDLSYNRYGCTGRPQEDLSVEIFCWRFILLTSVSITLIFIGADWLGFNSQLTIQKGLLSLTGLSVFFSVLGAMSQTRNQIQAGYTKIAITTLIAALVSTATNIFLAKYWRPDAWAMMVGSTAGLIVTFIMLGIPKLRALATKSGLSRAKRRELISFGFMGAAISAPLYWIISTSDRWFIDAYQDHKSVGIYGFTYNIAIIGQMLNSAFVVAWRTESVRNYEAIPQDAPRTLGRLWSRFVVQMALTWLVVTAAGGDIIRLLADRQFHDGVIFVPWIAGGVFFYGVSHLASTGLLLKKNMRPFTLWYLICAVISVMLNFIFVRALGVVGAAIVQCITFGIAAVGIMWTAQKIYPLIIDFRQIGIAISAIIIAGILMSPTWSTAPLFSLCYKFPVGVSIALAIFYYVSPDWFKRTVHHGLNIFKKNNKTIKTTH